MAQSPLPTITPTFPHLNQSKEYMEKVSRWELITSDEYLKVTADNSILFGHSFKDLRAQLYEFLKQYRDELLKGDTEKQPTTKNQGV